MEIIQILRSFASIANIPVTYFEGKQEVFHTSEFRYPSLMISQEVPRLLHNAKEPGHAVCTFTEELLCFGLIRIGKKKNTYAVFGPVSAIVCDNQRAQRILKKYGLPTTDTGLLLNFFKQTASCPLLRFAEFLILVNYSINRETLELTDLLPDDYHMEDKLVIGPAAPPNLSSTSHDAAAYEQELYAMIRFGRYPEMVEFLRSSTFTGAQGSLADTMLRHQKNMVVASATLASRAAVGGGLDYDTAMTLADHYIQWVELAQDRNALLILHNNMLKTYARLVAEKRANSAKSALVNRVTTYVSEHLSEKIAGETLAAALGMNRAYLSAQFKRETGMGLNEYVHRMKIDEAARLLIVTDLPISAVATRLGFSSQGYFQAIFKKVTSMNPSEYREGATPYT